jgi:hypothetical protein
MHYMDLSAEFGQFDRDNMYRWETAGYLNWSNLLLGDILAHPKVWKVKHLVAGAEVSAKRSINSFNNWNYLDAVVHARFTYVALKRAADLLGISNLNTDLEALRVTPNLEVPHEGDPIRFPDN